MKTKLRLDLILCITALLLVCSVNSFARKGPNLLKNYTFSVLDTVTTADTSYVFPRNWVYDADPLFQGDLLVFKWWESRETDGITRSWTGAAGEGIMYQELTGLADGTYEFTMNAWGMGTGKVFAIGYGGDSIGADFGNSTGQTYSTGLINVTNGTCRVGVYILNTADSYFDLYDFKFYLNSPTLPGVNLLSNYRFSELETVTTADTSYVFPMNWVYDADPLFQGDLLVFKWWESRETDGITRSWTGAAGEGIMYQELTGLDNGTYEYSMNAWGIGTGKVFATGYGGDSIGVEFGNSTGQAYNTGILNVTNGTCKVGVYILNTTDSYFDLYNFDFHLVIPPVPGLNLLTNYTFAVLDTVTTADTSYVFPRNWVYEANPLFQGDLLVFKWWEARETDGITRSWTGAVGEGIMYQELKGLANGTYEFSMNAWGEGSGKVFAIGFGGDSIGVNFGNSTGQTYKTGVINVTNGTCKVGVYINNTTASYFDLYDFKFYRIHPPVPGLNLLTNYDFTAIETVTTIDTSYSFPSTWVYDANPIFQGDLLVFKWWEKQEDYGIARSWTGVPGEGIMFQNVTGLLDGTYEFSIQAYGMGTGKVFATGYGADSIGVDFGNSTGQTYSTGLVNVTNGTCKVGVYINNTDVSYFDLYNYKFQLVIDVENSLSIVSAPLNIMPTDTSSVSVSYVTEQDGSVSLGLYDKNSTLISADTLLVKRYGGGIADFEIVNSDLPVGGGYYWYAELIDANNAVILDTSMTCSVSVDSIAITDIMINNPDSITVTVSYFKYERGFIKITVQSPELTQIAVGSVDIKPGGGTKVIKLKTSSPFVNGVTYNVCADLLNRLKVKVADDCEEITAVFVGVVNIADDGFNIYPNPLSRSAILNISTQQKGLSDIAIMDIQGKLMFRKSFSNSISINALELNLKTGVYFVKLNQNVRKLIVVD